MLGNMHWAAKLAGEAQALLDAMPDPRSKAGSQLLDIVVRFRKIAQEAAKEAAPYVHPKLATVDHRADDVPVVERIEIQYVKATHANDPERLPFLPSRSPTAVQQQPHSEAPQQQPQAGPP